MDGNAPTTVILRPAAEGSQNTTTAAPAALTLAYSTPHILIPTRSHHPEAGLPVPRSSYFEILRPRASG